MGSEDEINRRNLIVGTAGAIGAVAGSGLVAGSAEAAQPLPPGFADQKPLIDFWNKELNQVVAVDLTKDAPELADPGMQERHRIYSYLLMKLIHRFWNGNKRGPLGTYPQRAKQLDRAQVPADPKRYRGDMIENPGGLRVNWDRYLGHNIACLAVDGNGDIIDFDFNHNAIFRSSAEHAESRLVRRLFSLTNIFDSWKTGARFNGKPHAASLGDVTLYTTLESCAQCSGVMSLAGVKQIIYLQNDFTAYKIGNLMYKLANRLEVKNPDGSPKQDNKGNIVTIPGAPVPIPASEVGIAEFALLNQGNLDFARKMMAGTEFFFKPSKDGKEDRDPAITSFLGTDDAYELFAQGAGRFEGMTLQVDKYPYADQIPNDPDRVMTNAECLAEAAKFYAYVDAEGYRGSPHKL